MPMYVSLSLSVFITTLSTPMQLLVGGRLNGVGGGGGC